MNIKLTREQQFELIKTELDDQANVHGITYTHKFLKSGVTEIVFNWQGATYTWLVHLEYLITENHLNWYIIGAMLNLIRTILIQRRCAK